MASQHRCHRWWMRQVLRGAPARRTGVIRALAVTGVFLVAAGMGLPSDASAQASAQGQAAGILFLLGASRSGSQASAKTPGQKPKPGIAASHETDGRIVAAKHKPFSVKEGTVQATTGGETMVPIPEKVARLPDPLHGTVLRVTSDQKNSRNLDRPADLMDGSHAKHN